MSVYIINCKKCNHKFYDIIVSCDKLQLEKVCPICDSEDLLIKEMEKPKGKLWAEDQGCPQDCKKCPSNKDNGLYKLPDNLISKFQEPWGEILEKVPEKTENNIIITVGDVSSKKFIEKNIIPNLAIIDHKIQRQIIEKKNRIEKNLFEESYKVKNPASTISKNLYKIIEKIDFSKKNIIIIEGEEDLATLACILHSPENSLIFYGQPNKGLVKIENNKKTKHKAEDLFNSFVV